MSLSRKPPARLCPVVLPALWHTYEGPEHHAVTVDLSAAGIKLRASRLPQVERAITCQIRGFEPMQARVVSVGVCDFLVKLIGQTPAPVEVVRRLIELGKQQAREFDAVRINRRIVPTQTRVEVRLADGMTVPATILNLSASGVALHLEVPLVLGQAITVGSHAAIVTRLLPEGIGAVFVETFDQGEIHKGMVL